MVDGARRFLQRFSGPGKRPLVADFDGRSGAIARLRDVAYVSPRRRSSAAMRAAAAGSRKRLGSDRHERRAGVEQVARVRAALHAAHADDGDAARARRPPRPGPARRRGSPGPDSPPVPPPSHGARSPGAGRERHRAQRVDQRDGVGAAVLRRPARSDGTSAVFGVSLTISGLAVLRAAGADDLLAAAPGRRRCPGRSRRSGRRR